MDHVPDLYDQGLQADIDTLIDRRLVLQLMGLAGVFAVAACAPGGATSAAATASASTSCDPIPASSFVQRDPAFGPAQFNQGVPFPAIVQLLKDRGKEGEIAQ
jgi:hypothetical protein